MKLSEIMFYVGTQLSGEDIDIENICDDSRNVTKGSLFVCIKGAVDDGHEHAADAYEEGCRVFVTAKKIAIKPVWINFNSVKTKIFAKICKIIIFSFCIKPVFAPNV